MRPNFSFPRKAAIRSTARCINPKILISPKIRAVSQPWNRKLPKLDDDLHLERSERHDLCPQRYVILCFYVKGADVFRTIRPVIPKRVRSRHASQRTHTRKSDANGLSAIYINAARNSTIKMQRGRHQAVQNIKNCKRYSRWGFMRRRNDIDHDYGGKSILASNPCGHQLPWVQQKDWGWDRKTELYQSQMEPCHYKFIYCLTIVEASGFKGRAFRDKIFQSLLTAPTEREWVK